MSSTGHQLRALDAEASEAERERAEWVVQEAYADGKLDQVEFESRIGITLTAVTRRDLNDAVRGIRTVARPSLAQEAVAGTTLQPHRPIDPARQERGRAAAAHLSGLVSLGIGPLIAYVTSTPGTYQRREAAKATNFQLATVGVAAGIVLPWSILWWWNVGSYPDLSMIFWVVLAHWLVSTLAGAAAALAGLDLKHPLMQLTRLELLREGPPKTLRSGEDDAPS